jgi:hypothetical protein
MSVVKVLYRGTESKSIFSSVKGLRVGRGKIRPVREVFESVSLTKGEARKIRQRLDAIGRRHQSLESL